MSIVKPTREGTLPFEHQGDKFETFYKVFGDLEGSKRTPLVVCHGGPGFVHDYLIPFADLSAKSSVPVILYDQLGNGRSTHLKDKPPTFWTIDLFCDELANLLRGLRIDSAFDLAGHSWGGCLINEFEIRRKPAGLRHLVLTNTLASSALWGQSTGQLISKFPKEIGEGMGAGMKDPAKFIAAYGVFMAVHICTVKPTPEPVNYTVDQVFGSDGDPTVAGAPIMKDWTVIDRLKQIRVPAFVINGRSDQAQDFVVAPLFQQIPKAKWVTFENSSHMPFWEERERFVQLVDEFLAL